VRVTLTVTLNGEPCELPEGATVVDAVRAVGAPDDGRGVAAAVGGEVVPRGAWETHALSPDDRVEVLQAVQGG
jgi:sulfur carrier protein